MSISNLLNENNFKLFCSGLDAGLQKITNVAPPTENYDCPNKAYVDAQASLAGTLSQVLAAGNDGNGDDMLNIGEIESNTTVCSNDLILFKSPNPSSLAQRSTPRNIICNNGDTGLPNYKTAQISMFGDSSTGVMGHIVFSVQKGNTVPGSTFHDTMVIKGDAVGINTPLPVCEFESVGGNCLGTSFPGVIHPGRSGGTRGAPLAVRSLDAPVSGPGGFVFEAGTTSDGLTSDYSTISTNMWVANGAQFAQPLKLGWRFIYDQRTGVDKYQLGSIKSATCPNIQRIWTECDGVLGNMELNNSIIIANSSAGSAPTPSDRAILRPKTHVAVDLGTSSFAFGVGWIDSLNPSDRNLKKDIEPLSHGLEFLSALRPKQYRFKRNDSERVHYGFIAQEVEELFTSVGDTDGSGNAIVIRTKKEIYDPDWVRPVHREPVKDWNGDPNTEERPFVDVPDMQAQAPIIQTNEDLYGMRYIEFVPVLTKAIQELNDIVKEQAITIAGLRQDLDNLSQP